MTCAKIILTWGYSTCTSKLSAGQSVNHYFYVVLRAVASPGITLKAFFLSDAHLSNARSRRGLHPDGSPLHDRHGASAAELLLPC
jgi:hypothetical protein